MLAINTTAVIYGSYVVVFGVLAAYASWVIRRGRSLADEVDDAEKYWG